MSRPSGLAAAVGLLRGAVETGRHVDIGPDYALAILNALPEAAAGPASIFVPGLRTAREGARGISTTGGSRPVPGLGCSIGHPSMGDLARFLRVNTSTVSAWERVENRMPIEKAEEAATGLGVGVSDLTRIPPARVQAPASRTPW